VNAFEALKETVESSLTADAKRLASGRNVPIDVEGLLGELGIGLRFAAESGAVRRGGLTRIDSTWEIVVNQAAAMTRERQRFTIAHELGHYFIEARFNYRPRSTREYWAIEQLCQAFAAELLAPSHLVESLIGSGRPSTPEQILDALPVVANTLGVSIEVAAGRIVRNVRNLVGLAAVDVLQSSGQPAVDIPTLLWVWANQPWICGGRGKQIARRHALAVGVSRLRDLAAGERVSLDLGELGSVGAERRSSRVVILAGVLDPSSKRDDRPSIGAVIDRPSIWGTT
jgi:hypothetical protein